MQLTYKFNYYKNFSRLSTLCIISKNLYNQGNYLVKQELENNHKLLKYNDLDKLLKETKNLENEINYKLLKSKVSQQTLKVLDKNWKSYFNSLKEYKKNPKKFKGLPKVPNYKKEVNQLIFTNQACSIKNDKLFLYKNNKTSNNKPLIIKIPKYLNKNFEKFNQVRINPRNNFFEIEIVYTVQEKEKIENNNVISIDLGVNNFATLVSNVLENPIIFSGKILKSINQNYNKKVFKLKSIKDKMKIKKSTKRIQKINNKRERRLNDIEHKISRKIVAIATSKNVSTIIVGKNKNWKTSIKLGNKNNQTFVQIPHARFICKLAYKCKMNGITLIETEESYTSKIDHLAFEEMKEHDSYLGKRIKRGLFQSSSGILINSDVNGGLGILRKFLDKNKNVVDDSLLKEIINMGNLLTPFKIRNIFDIQTLNKVVY